MDSLTRDVLVDARLRAAAERDVYRALLLQNARVSARWDVARARRTPAFERRLRIFGTAVASVGALVVSWMAVRHALAFGTIPVSLAALTLVFVGLALVFIFAPGIRAAGVRAVDRSIRGRGRRFLSKTHVGDVLRYHLDDTGLRAETVQNGAARPRYQRPHAVLRYALVGESTVVFFKKHRAQNPSAIVFSSGEDLVAACRDRGIELELLTRDLLPASVLEREW